MNKIYKVIWSKVRNCYVAVSEIAKRNGKSCTSVNCGGSANRRRIALGLVLALSLSLAGGGVAWAADVTTDTEIPNSTYAADSSTIDFTLAGEAGAGITFTVNNGGKVKSVISTQSGNTIIIQSGAEVVKPQYVQNWVLVGGISNNNITVAGSVLGGYVLGGKDSGGVTNNTVTVSGTVGSDTSTSYLHGGHSTGNGNVTSNTVEINGGTVKGEVYGGYSVSGNVGGTGNNKNTVTISGGTVSGNVYGGYVSSASGSGSAINNAVDISGSATIGTSGSSKNIHGGYANGNGEATGNTVSINLVTNDKGTPDDTTDDTGVIWGTVYGGYSASGKVGGSNEEDGNTVTISGGKVSGDVYGGYGNSSGYNSPVIYNTVKIESGTVTGNVYGGYAISSKAGEYLSGKYIGNYVTISGGTVGGFVIGGYSQNCAIYNEVTISGETNNKSIITGNIIGGQSGGGNSVEINIVTINDNCEVSGSIYGAITGNGWAYNNRVYINGGTIHSSEIAGGDSSSSSTQNAVIIKGGTFNSNGLMIYGGKSSSSSAEFASNFVTLAGGSFASGSFNTESDYLRIIGGYNGGSTNARYNTVNLYGSVTGLEKAELWGFYPNYRNGSTNWLYIGGTRDDSTMLASGTTASPWTGTTGNKVKSVNNFSTIFLKNVNWDTATPVLAAETFTNKNNNDSKLDISGIEFNAETPLTLGTMTLLKSDTQDDALSSINLNYIDKDNVTQYNQPISDDGIKLKSISDFGTDTSITGVSVAYDGARKVTRDSDDTSTSINYTIYPEYKSATLGGTTLGAMNWGEGYTFASGAAINSGGLAVTIDGNFAVTGAVNQENNQSFNLLDLSATSGTIADSPSPTKEITGITGESQAKSGDVTLDALKFAWSRTDTVAKNSDGNKLVYTTGATSKVTTATFNGEIAWNTGTPYYNAAGSVYTFDGDTAINATNLTFTGTTDTNPMGQSTVLLANATNISGDHITQPGTGIGTVTVSGYTENGMTYDATAKGTVTVVSTDTSKNVNYTINNVVASKVTLGSLDWGKTDTALPTGWTASGMMMVDDTNFGYSGTASTALKAGNTSTILTASGLTETGSVTLGTNKTVGMNYTDADSGINFVGTVNGHVAAAENAVNYVVDSVTLSTVDLAGWKGTGYTMAAGDAWNANGSGVTVATENITNLPTLSAGASQPILTAASANYFSDDKISGKNKYQAYGYAPSVVNGVTFDGSQSKGVKTNDDKSGLVYAVGKMDVSTVSFGTMAWGTGRAASTADDFTSLTGSNINASNLSFTFTATDKEGLSKTSSMTLLSDAVNLTAGLTVTGASRTQAIDYAAGNGAALSGTLTGTVVTEASEGVGTIKFNASSMTLDSVNLAGWDGTTASTVPTGWDKNAAGVTVATENMTNLPSLDAGTSKDILTTTTANYFSDDKISATNKYQAYSYTPSVVNGVTFGGSQSKGVKTAESGKNLVYAVGKMDVSTVSFDTMAWGTGRAASTADDFTSLTGSNINASNLSFTFTATDKEGLSKTSSMTLLSGAANLTAGLTVTGASRAQTIDYAAGNGAALSGTLTGTVVTEASEGVGTIKFNASSMTLDSVNLAGWDGTTASTVPAGWDKNSAGVTVATENMTNLPTLSAGATQAILTTTTANYFSDDKISATNKYQAYSYTPSVVNGVTFGGSQSKGVKTNDDKSGLVYAVGKMDVSTVSFDTMAWGTGRAASTADDFTSLTGSNINASNLSFTFTATDKEGLSKTSSMTLLSDAVNLTAGLTVTGASRTQAIDYAAGNGAALSGTLTGTVVTEASEGVGTIKFNASSMTLDSVNLAGWDGTTASTVPTGWDKNAAGVTVATENMTNLPSLDAGTSKDILTTTTANYFSDDKISATNKYQAYSYTPSVVNGVTFGGSQSKGVKTNDDKSGLVYAVGKMDVSTVSFDTMAWGTGRAASTADDFAGVTTVDASNLSFTFSDTDKEGLSKTSSTTLLSGAANLAAGKTVTYKNSGTNYTQTIDYAASNGAALSGTLTGTVVTEASEGVGTIKFNASSMTLDSVNLAGWDGTTASTVPAGWDKNSAGVTVATENMTNLPSLDAGTSKDILTTTTANYFSDDKISATNKYQAYSYTPSVVNGVTFGGSQSKGVKTNDDKSGLVYAVGKMDVSTVSFDTMAWGTGRAASTADDFTSLTGSNINASNLSFTFTATDKEGLSKTSSMTLLSDAVNLTAGLTVTGASRTQTIDYAAGNGAALSGTLTGTVVTEASAGVGTIKFNASSMTLDSVNLAGWDGTTTSAVPTGWDKNAAGVTVYTNSMTNLPELAAGASRDILTASSGFFTFEKIEGTNKYGNGDAFSDNLNDIAVAGHKQGGIKDTDSGAKLTFFAIRKNVEDITLGEMTFADGGKGATLTSEYDATGATINADNLKFTEASRSLMTSGSSMTIVDASAAIKNAGGNALPSFAAKNYDSTFTDSVTDQLTLTGTRRDTLTQDAAQTKLTYTVGDRVVSKAAMSGEIAWQSGDTHYANTAYTFNSSTAVDIANVKFTATDDPLNTSMTLIGNAAGVTAGNVSGSPDFTVALKNTTITATATGNASMDAGDLKYTVTGVTLDSVSVNGVGSDAIPAGWGTVANVQIDTDNMTVPADATYGSPQVIMTASSAIFTDDNIIGSKKFGANPARFTDEDNTDAVVIVGKQNAGVKASADGKSLLYEVGKKEASSVTLAKVDWAKGATVFDGSSEEYDYSGIQSLGTDSFDVAYSAPEMVAAGDNMTLLQANATLKDMAAETRSASYSFAPVSGVTIDAAVTGSLEAKGGNVTYTATANQASKLTFTSVDWKDSGALMTRPSNITFAGADVDTTKIHFKNIKELDANKKMTLVSDFGDSVGTITGTKYTVGAGLEGEGAASLSGSDLVFTTKTGVKDLAAQEQTHNTLMVMEAGMAVLAAGNEYVGQTMAELGNPQNVGLDGTVTAASLGGSKSRYKTGSHVDSNNWNVAVAVGSKRELKKGSLEWGVFGEYGKSNYTLHSDAGRGDGDSHYAGGGLMAKWTNKHDVYTEASVRLGRLNDTASNLLRDAAGNGYGYDVHANYFGTHVGIGKIIRYKGGKSLDVYGKYFYTKRDGVDFTSGGNNYRLDSVASSVLRVGARYGTTDKKWNWYGGLAYEYEFDGKSEGTVDGIGIRAASVKGGSVRGEIGMRMNATKTNPWQTDISIYGYGGKHRGFGGSVNVAYMF